MKFQDSSYNGLKVTVGTKSVTHARTHVPKAICPINFFKVGGIKILYKLVNGKRTAPLINVSSSNRVKSRNQETCDTKISLFMRSITSMQ